MKYSIQAYKLMELHIQNISKKIHTMNEIKKADFRLPEAEIRPDVPLLSCLMSTLKSTLSPNLL